jgi:starvation-inducible DNA-binding protein
VTTAAALVQSIDERDPFFDVVEREEREDGSELFSEPRITGFHVAHRTAHDERACCPLVTDGDAGAVGEDHGRATDGCAIQRASVGPQDIRECAFGGDPPLIGIGYQIVNEKLLVRIDRRTHDDGHGHEEIVMNVNIGIDAKQREQIAQNLSRVLADSYTLYLKTHNFHWNVTGPMFQTLHLMFEQHYNELALAVDALAERIRALGLPAPGTYRKLIELSSVKEEEHVPKAREMIRLLVEGHETVARTARASLEIADAANDQATADLLTQRLQVHEKTAWMLRSLLDDE